MTDGAEEPPEGERSDPDEETTAAAEGPAPDDGDPDTMGAADSDPAGAAPADGDPEEAAPSDGDSDEVASTDSGVPTDGDPEGAGARPGGQEVPGPSDLVSGTRGDAGSGGGESAVPNPEDVPPDVRTYDRFTKIDGSTYDRANEFLRDRTYITAREWAIARLCADFRTETGVEMTKIGENLPHLVPFMTDTYTPQAVNQARHAFEEKVRKAGATFLYGAMCDFFTAEELDDVMYEATEVAKFLLEVEGVDLAVEEELAAEERISSVMREVRQSSAALRHDEVHCPACGHSFEAAAGSNGRVSESSQDGNNGGDGESSQDGNNGGDGEENAQRTGSEGPSEAGDGEPEDGEGNPAGAADEQE